MSDEFMPTLHWLKFLILNVDGDMDDAQFREFIRHNLPTVMGYKHAYNELVALGRIPREIVHVELTGDPVRDKELMDSARRKLSEQETRDVGTEILTAGFQEGSGYGDHDVPSGDFRDRDTEPFHKK